ncbi:hypothetical protein GPALN_003047 [Globodera pallida]|uniref:Uncharacterized protein n=1 Tax=Globodera pallida TaxID=36090 RepID=A0A183C661_GLOPA|nr:hypothetical protein GPALN_003047 [Globodera pallida]
MASALLPQCARPLLVVVAALLLCCCRPVEAQEQPELPDFNEFNCARTGVGFGFREFPKDNQTRINSWKLGRVKASMLLGLLMNTKDELKLTMVGGASCPSVFSEANVNGAKCVLGKATKVNSKHQPKDPPCTGAAGCKAFTLNCPFEEDNFVHLPAGTHVVKIYMEFFLNLVDKRCEWRAYIDNARHLLYGPERFFGEECPGSARKTTEDPKKTTTGSTEATTTNSSDTMTTGSTDPMESTDANITSGWTLIIVVSVVGSIMFIAVASAVVLVLWHRKQRTSDDAAKVEGEEDEKASSTKTPPKDASSAKSSEKKQTSEDASGSEGEDEASSANTPKKVPSSAVEGVEVPNSLYSKASPDDDDEGSSVV